MKEFEKIQEADWVVAPRELAAPVITRRFYVGAAMGAVCPVTRHCAITAFGSVL